MILFIITLFACKQERQTVTTKSGTEITIYQGRPVYCYGKRDRARPSCWTSYDWEIYCSRVDCKRQNSSK